MRGWKWSWAPAVLVIAVVAIEYWRTDHAGRDGGAGSAPIETPGDADTHADDDAWAAIRDLVRDLSSDDQALREEAGRRLAALPTDNRGALRAAARDVGDADVRRQIDRRLAELDEDASLHPAPVSLHVHGERLAEVLTELNGRMGTNMDTVPFANVRHELYSIDAEKRPFWEIMADLNRQHPLWIPNVRADRRLSIYDSAPGMENVIIKGDFIFFTRWLPAPEPKPGQGRRAALSLTFAADPRMRVLEIEETLDPVTDERGQVLYHPSPEQPFWSEYNRHSTASSCPRTIELELPAEGGQRIVSLKEHVRVVISLADVDANLDDVEQWDQKTIELGNTSVEISAQRMDPLVNQQVMVTGMARSATTRPHVTYEIWDPTGFVLIRWGGTERSGYSSGIRPGPYRLHISAAQKTAEFTMDFEVRDLAIPQP